MLFFFQPSEVIYWHDVNTCKVKVPADRLQLIERTGHHVVLNASSCLKSLSHLNSGTLSLTIGIKSSKYHHRA